MVPMWIDRQLTTDRQNTVCAAARNPLALSGKWRRWLVFGLLAGLCLDASYAADRTPWQVKTASLRYRVNLVEHPTVDSAGYIVMIPDGGILPGPHPVSTVIDAGGNEVPSYTLYYTRKYGLAVLFGKPRTGKSVYVYIRGDVSLNLFSPESGMTPGMLLYVNTGRNSLTTAKQLKPGKAPDTLQLIRHKPTGDNPLQISCETTRQAMHWKGPPYSARLTGYLMTTDPGRTWISPFSIYRTQAEPTLDGMEVYIDGNRIEAETKLSNKSCGRGEWMDLSAGLHKIDIYHAADPERDRFAALVVTWRTPGTTIEDLGGPRGKDLPYPGTPMWEARPLHESEIVRSGTGKIASIEERNGAPVACLESKPLEIFWLSDETQPLLLYEFQALTSGDEEAGNIIWQPGGRASIEGKKKILWVFPGYRESVMTLTITSGSRSSTTALPFFGYAPTLRTDLNDPAVRARFREACLEIVQAYPPNEDPMENWNDTLWELFLANMELGSGGPLLARIFSGNLNSMTRRLDATNRWRLEDFYYEWLSFTDPEECIRWLEKTEKNERHPERRKELRLMQADVCMYSLKDFDRAKELAASATAGSSDVSAIATVRLGDIEFLRGNINEALRLYGEVQSKSVADTYAGTDPAGLQWSAPPKWKTDAGDARLKIARPGQEARVADWKKGAILNTSASETARTLLEQGYYEEARNVLQRWERLFPLSKLSSDYIIHQAALCMKLANYGKARLLLESYCSNVETSSFTAPAVELLLDCMVETRATYDEFESFAEAMKKRLEFHPVAGRIDAVLNRLKRRAR